MTDLLDAQGMPVASSSFKKAPPPKQGEAFGIWGGENVKYANMPGFGIVQFDLSKLTLQDYRAMREHYQVNASLSVLSFMQHQSDWHIECENKKIADECETQLSQIWTQLNRAMSVANWAGYSPNILQWENSASRTKTEITKVKDLIPEMCRVNWKEVEAWSPPGINAKPKIQVYDGIKQEGVAWPVPVENTFWYPLLMEHGSYYGKNLLKPAFTSWYFSILIHLFANRYYERYGEPIVKGRAPFENDVIMPNGDQLNGMEYLLTVMQQMRNRSVIALPDDKTEMSNGRMEFDFDIQYLESQMRGADWERYLTRLDEEISIGLFTPILLLRTADVGSYNLGVGHMQMYLWMLNAMNDDRALYINKYILNRIADTNFGVNSARPKIKFRKLGNQNAETIKTIVQGLMNKDKLAFDIQELGEIVGMKIEEVEELTTEPDPVIDPEDPWGEDANDPSAEKAAPKGVGDPRSTAKEITARIARQVENAYKRNEVEELVLDFGYKRKLAQDLYRIGKENPEAEVESIYKRMSGWSQEVLSTGKTIFKKHDDFMRAFEAVFIGVLMDHGA